MYNIDQYIQKLNSSQASDSRVLYLNDLKRYAEGQRQEQFLEELDPYAAYIENDEIKILFFIGLSSKDNHIQKTLWNSQVPLIISEDGGTIFVYSGKQATIQNGKIYLLEISSYNNGQQLEPDIHMLWKGQNNKNVYFDYLLNDLDSLYDALCVSDVSKDETYTCLFYMVFFRNIIDRFYDRNIFLTGEEDTIRYLKEYLSQHFDVKTKCKIDKFYEKASSYDQFGQFLFGYSDMVSNQYSLFKYFDFRFMPIHVLGSAYEVLLDKRCRDEQKSYYTPHFLVDTIMDRELEYSVKKVLDPSCGAGIFLVCAYQKMLRYGSRKNSESKADYASRILRDYIFGMDIDQTAVTLTVFSLYIVMADYCGNRSFIFPDLSRNIICADFFSDEGSDFLNNGFDVIAGNPPWGKASGEYCGRYIKENRIAINEASSAFLKKIMDTRCRQCSLVLPSKFLYNQKGNASQLRFRLLKDYRINYVFELSSLRQTLFRDAKAPACVISFSYSEDKYIFRHIFEYTAFQNYQYSDVLADVCVEPNNVKYIPQKFLLENDNYWKAFIYGNSLDIVNLDHLKGFPTINDIMKSKGITLKVGLQIGGGDKKDSEYMIGRKLLDGKSKIMPFRLEYSGELFDRKTVHRPRNRELFKPPYVLCMKGIDTKNYSFKATYVNDDYVFTEAYHCFHGGDEDTLVAITALLNSKLYAYLNVLQGSSIMTEREQVFLREVRKYPFITDEKITAKAKLLLKNELSREEYQKNRDELDQLIFECFQLKSPIAIDYMLNIMIPKKNSVFILEDEKGYQEYAFTFIKKFKQRIAPLKFHFRYGYGEMIAGLKILVIELTADNSFADGAVMVKMDPVIYDMVNSKIYDNMIQIKNIVMLKDDRIILIKPEGKRYWHPLNAYIDADRVYGMIQRGEMDYE